MLALAPSKGWNYQGTLNGNAVTVSLYADPNLVNGVRAWIASAVTGTQTTVLTSASNVNANLAGALGLTVDASNNYTAVSELSAGGASPIPGGVEFIPSTLTQGQTWTADGGTATVIAVSVPVNGSAACGSSALGVKVRYTYPPASIDNTISYVPGCGLTDIVNNNNSQELALVSVGTYASIGQLSQSRRVGTATYLDTIKSALGLEHLAMPAGTRLRGAFGI